MSTKELPSIPDNLLLFLSNKILYKKNGKFIFEHINLSEIISNARIAYKVPEDTPVTLVSILGSPSNEKFLFMKSLVEYYERGMKDNSLFDGGFEPKTKDLATSGVYLVPKPFLVQQDKKKGLVWILYLFRSENAVEEDIRLLERFLLLACSRIAEVKFEKESFPLLQQWSELDGVQHPRCNDFLYVFPSNAYIATEEQGSAMLRSVAEGRNKLYYKMERFRTGQRDTSIIAKIPNVSVIEMKTVEEPLYKNFFQAEPEEQAVSHSLKQCIREDHQSFKLGGLKFDKQGHELQLGNLFEFWKDCAASALSPLSKNQALARNIAQPNEFKDEINVLESTSNSTASDGNDNATNRKKGRYNQPPQLSQQYDNIQDKISPRVHAAPNKNPNVSENSPMPQEFFPLQANYKRESESTSTSPVPDGSNAQNLGEVGGPSDLNCISPVTTSTVEARDQKEVDDSAKLHVTDPNGDTTNQPTNQHVSHENKVDVGYPPAGGVKLLPNGNGSHDGCQNNSQQVDKDEGNNQNENKEGTAQSRSNEDQPETQEEINASKSISQFTDIITIHADDGGNDNVPMSNISATPAEICPGAVPTLTEGESQDVSSSVQQDGLESPKPGDEVSPDLSANHPPGNHQTELSNPDHRKINENGEKLGGTRDDDSQPGSEGNEISVSDPSATLVDSKPSNTENDDGYQDDSNKAKLGTSQPDEDHSENENDDAIAKTFIPELVLFYNDEMKRFLSEDLYDPATLKKIHENLKMQLTSQFLGIFKVDEDQMNELGEELLTLLDKGFPRHSQRNSENWKMKQAKISKCLQKMMSSYMEQIENVLQQHPNGLENQDLERKRDDIVNGVQVRLATEIRANVRGHEPMDRHQDSLMAEIKEYWDCVVERNDQNLREAQPTEAHDTHL